VVCRELISDIRPVVRRIGGAILSNELEDLALSLSFLNRLGLYPVILHGAGPQLNEILEREGVVPDYEDGIRITGELGEVVGRETMGGG